MKHHGQGPWLSQFVNRVISAWRELSRAVRHELVPDVEAALEVPKKSPCFEANFHVCQEAGGVEGPKRQGIHKSIIDATTTAYPETRKSGEAALLHDKVAMLLLGRRAHILGGDDEKFLTGRLVHISDAMLAPKFKLQLAELTPVARTVDELAEGLTVSPLNSDMLTPVGSERGPRGLEVFVRAPMPCGQ